MATTKKKAPAKKPVPQQRRTAVKTQVATPESIPAGCVKCTVKKTFAFGNQVYKAGTDADIPEIAVRKLRGYLCKK